VFVTIRSSNLLAATSSAQPCRVNAIRQSSAGMPSPRSMTARKLLARRIGRIVDDGELWRADGEQGVEWRASTLPVGRGPAISDTPGGRGGMYPRHPPGRAVPRSARLPAGPPRGRAQATDWHSKSPDAVTRLSVHRRVDGRFS